jgi:BirA family biotin operon repressor/biotin-[acetyl-CoA-carboxylase] ligase
MNTLSPRSIKAQLKTKIIGRKIHLFGELDSTNSEAYRMALEGAEEGEVIIADCQLRGKGRLGRPWHSPPGVNLYISIILRPPIPPRSASLITIMAAVATAKKVAGLLNEMKLLGEKVEFIILGIGINVNMTLATVPGKIQSTATSLREELGYDTARDELLKALLREVEGEYRTLLTGEHGRILRQWEEFSQMVGKVVEMKSSHEVVQGRVKGIDWDGSLLLSNPDGSESRVIAGDISHVGELP